MSAPRIAPLSPGDPVRVGPYELAGRLWEESLGTVYLARDGRGGHVAVKLMHAWAIEGDTARARFTREMKVVERVAGPGTLRVLSSGVAGDRAYVAGEYAAAPTLAEWLAETGPLDAPSLVRLAIGTAAALAAIHRAGIAYRVFRPSSVLIAPECPRVACFGMADALCWSEHEERVMMGSAVYATPEQLTGGRSSGPEGDMFAWASVVVFAATGRYPFEGADPMATLVRILQEEPDLPPLPPALAGAVGACLAKDPARRPSGDAVVRGLLE